MDVDEVLGDPKSSIVPTKSAIYVWGYYYSGQTERESQSRVPKHLPPELFGCRASRWFDVACGRAHTAAVASDEPRVNDGTLHWDQTFLVSSGVRLLQTRLFAKSAVDLFVLQLCPNKPYCKPGAIMNVVSLVGDFHVKDFRELTKAYAKFLDEPPELVKIT